MSQTILGRCWNCGADLGPQDYGRETNCIGCSKSTRACRNCRWYTPGHSNDCVEPMAERVLEKERANYCEFFEPTTDTGSTDASSPDDVLRKAAEDLFKL